MTVPGLLATIVTFGLFVFIGLSHSANVRSIRAQMAAARARRGTVMPQLEPPPERQALPPTPLVIVLGDFYWTSQEMADDMVKAALRVARNYGELETVRELTAARRVVKGELAS